MCALYKGVEIPDNDAERVRALESYEVLDSAQEQDFDDITELAASLTGCKVSYIGFFDQRRMWLKAKYGLPPDLTERPRELTLCAPTICQSDLLVVPDMSKDPRYRELPSVKDPPNAKFYCAMPLINPDGFALGTLCVWDSEAMDLSPSAQQSMRRLARLVLSKLELRREIIELQRQTQEALRARDAEKASGQKYANLLQDLFPSSLAKRVVDGETVEPRFYQSASVMFVDFKGFTSLAETTEPRVLIEQLGDFFVVFDRIVEKHGLEKIKTIGDGYLAVGGIPMERRDHAHQTCLAALDIREAMRKRNAGREKLSLPVWPVRIGIHSGAVIAGIVGTRRMAYDVWGDGVNLASRLQTNSEAGEINISESTVGLIGDAFKLQERGLIEAKNKGPQRMYYLLGRADG